MLIRPDSEKPIFLQISQGLEDAILAGVYPEESQIPSITEFATTYKINPATALKGINLLVDAGIVYKKRGLGMFVAPGAVEKLREKHFAAWKKEAVRQEEIMVDDVVTAKSYSGS